MRFIPTKVHAPLDYIVGLALIAAPWIFQFSDHTAATVVPIVLGVGLTTKQRGGYSYPYDESFSASHAFATRFCARVSQASSTRSRSSSRSSRARLGMRANTAA
jgi:SPW repeat